MKGIILKNAFKSYRNNSSNTTLKNRLRHLEIRLNISIKYSKTFYHKIVNKLNDTQKNAQAYWFFIKMILNNKKIPLIPTLLYNIRFIRNFKEKAEPFNPFSSEKCSLISNNSSLPS